MCVAQGSRSCMPGLTWPELTIDRRWRAMTENLVSREDHNTTHKCRAILYSPVMELVLSRLVAQLSTQEYITSIVLSYQPTVEIS